MDDGQRASDQAGGDSVGAACGPPLFCVSEKKGEKHPETLQKEKKSHSSRRFLLILGIAFLLFFCMVSG